jgi:hypothetical protein
MTALPRSLATLVVAFTLVGCVQPAPTYILPAPAPTRTPIRPASWPAFRDACVKGGTPVAICVCVFNTITARYPEEEVAAITGLPVTDGPLPAIVGACQQRMSTAF